MEVHEDVIKKLICDQVLNNNVPDHIKDYVSNLMLKSGESYINLILHLVINQPQPLILNEQDFILYKIKKDWKIKDLGELDVLLDKGYAFKLNNETLFLGKIKDSSGYGAFCSYDTTFSVESYGVSDDLKLKIRDNQVDYIDILPVNSIISSLLYSNMQKLEER